MSEKKKIKKQTNKLLIEIVFEDVLLLKNFRVFLSSFAPLKAITLGEVKQPQWKYQMIELKMLTRVFKQSKW